MDCIVRLFTRKSGRIAAFFKKGLLAKKGNTSAQAPALANVGIIDSTFRLSRLVALEILPTTLSLMATLRAFGYAAYLAELVEKFLPEGDPSPEIFLNVEETLSGIMQHGAKAFLLRSFELRLLDYSGYLPELPGLDDEDKIVAFDPVGCKLLTTASDESIPFSASAVRIARTMLIAKIGTVNYDDSVELLMIGRIFQSRLRLMGFGPLKSVAFLRQIAEL